MPCAEPAGPQLQAPHPGPWREPPAASGPHAGATQGYSHTDCTGVCFRVTSNHAPPPCFLPLLEHGSFRVSSSPTSTLSSRGACLSSLVLPPTMIQTGPEFPPKPAPPPRVLSQVSHPPGPAQPSVPGSGSHHPIFSTLAANPLGQARGSQP